jgi:two-component system sensor histidine kinase AgrC
VIYAAAVVILLYYTVFLFYCRGLVPRQGGGLFRFFLSLAVLAGSYASLSAADLLWLRIPVLAAAMMTGMRIFTGMDWFQSVYCGGHCILSVYSFRGIFTALGSFIFRSRDFLSDPNAYYSGTLFALPASLLLFWSLRATIFPDSKIRYLLKNPSQLKYVIAYELLAILNLMVIFSGRYLSPHGVWYMGVTLGACVLTIGMLIYAVYHALRSTELLEQKWRHQMLEEQLDRQLLHYKSYQKYTESFRSFQHDYRSMMASLKSLIRADENEQAVKLIDGLYDDMQKRVRIHKRYSDHLVLDAMLQDAANLCEEKKIRFSFQVSVPRNTGLSLPDAIRIFSNITSNAIEACEKLPSERRFIEITSRNDAQWSTLETVNSYDGNAPMENGKFVTTKPESQNHGLGLRIIADVVEGLGGFIMCDADSGRGVFRIRVHIPRRPPTAGPSAPPFYCGKTGG